MPMSQGRPLGDARFRPRSWLRRGNSPRQGTLFARLHRLRGHQMRNEPAADRAGEAPAAANPWATATANRDHRALRARGDRGALFDARGCRSGAARDHRRHDPGAACQPPAAAWRAARRQHGRHRRAADGAVRDLRRRPDDAADRLARTGLGIGRAAAEQASEFQRAAFGPAGSLRHAAIGWRRRQAGRAEGITVAASPTPISSKRR